MKKNDKTHVLIKAAVFCIGFFIVGFFVGQAMGKLMKGVSFADLFKVDHTAAGITLTVIQAVITIGGLIVSAVVLMQTSKRAERWDGEDEDEIDAIEDKLNIPVIICMIVFILNIVLFSCASYFLLPGEKYWSFASVVVFLIGMIFTSVINEKAVILEKKLNPEKKGSTFDLKIKKKWMESCDEAEKQQVWQSGYAAFKAGNMACCILWVVTFVLEEVLKLGVLPIICLGTIWLTMNTAYALTAAKLQKRR